MPPYFKPLRRKIGVMTLVLACVLMAAWVNGQRVLHTILPMGNTAFQVVSKNGTLTFRKVMSGYTIKASGNDADKVLLDITPSENPSREWKFPVDTETYGEQHRRSLQLWGLCFSHVDLKIPEISDAHDIHLHSPSLRWFRVSAWIIPL